MQPHPESPSKSVHCRFPWLAQPPLPFPVISSRSGTHSPVPYPVPDTTDSSVWIGNLKPLWTWPSGFSPISGNFWMSWVMVGIDISLSNCQLTWATGSRPKTMEWALGVPGGKQRINQKKTNGTNEKVALFIDLFLGPRRDQVLFHGQWVCCHMTTICNFDWLWLRATG